MTAAPEVVESIEHLDNFNPPCSIRIETGRMLSKSWSARTITSPCEEPAAFALRCRTCKAVGYVCTKHAGHVASTPRVICSSCRTEGLGITLYEFLPLGGH